MITRPRIGVLALQGDFAKHAEALAAAGASVNEVRVPSQLEALDGLIIPGGESTTLLKLMEGTTFIDDIRRFHGRGGAIYGTCAGLILLAKQVRNPMQRSLELLDAEVLRNGYGRQIESFEKQAPIKCLGNPPFRMIFIRAPTIETLGRGVEILATCNNRPVMVRSSRLLATTFHPELTPDIRIHKFFAVMCMECAAVDTGEVCGVR